MNAQQPLLILLSHCSHAGILLHEESNPAAYVTPGRTKDWQYLTLNSNTKSSSEVGRGIGQITQSQLLILHLRSIFWGLSISLHACKLLDLMEELVVFSFSELLSF